MAEHRADSRPPTPCLVPWWVAALLLACASDPGEAPSPVDDSARTGLATGAAGTGAGTPAQPAGSEEQAPSSTAVRAEGAPSAAPTSAASTDPMTDAYAALEAADYDALPDLIARLDAASEADPDNGRLLLYGGTMRMWMATGGPRSAGEELNDVLGAIERLEQAKALRPEDPHVNAFLSIAQVGLGNALRDEERIEHGHELFDAAIEFYPAYLSGVSAQAYGMLPRAHRYFPDAVTAVTDTLSHCGYQAFVDDHTADIPYPDSSESPQGTCWNGGVVDHLWEGILIIFGDIYVKHGDVDSALNLYSQAERAPNFDAFLFEADLEARIADAEDRAALYLDDDPFNDPPTWMEGDKLCVGCHASKQ